MRKTRSIRNFVLISIIAFIGLIFTVLSFDVPFTHNTYVGFARALPLGKDLGGGVVAVYEITTPEDFEGDYLQHLKNTVKTFSEILNDGYGEANVVLLNDKYIRIEAANVKNISNTLSFISNTGLIEFKTEKSETATAEITSVDIKNVEYAYTQGTHGIVINFTKTGAKKFENLTRRLSESEAPMYIYVNGELFSGEEGLKISDTVYGGTTFLSSSNETSARGTVLKLVAGVNEVQLKLIDEVNVYNGVFGKHTLVYISIIAILAVVVAFALLYVFYKHLGLLGILNLTFIIIFTTLIVSLIPNLYLTLTTYLGLIFGFTISVLTTVFVFERLKKELLTGKKFPVSVKYAYKSLVPALLDIYLPLFIACLVVKWIGSNIIISSFAMPLMVSFAVSLLFSLFVLRFFIYNYLPLNKNNLEYFGIKGGVNNGK